MRKGRREMVVSLRTRHMPHIRGGGKFKLLFLDTNRNANRKSRKWITVEWPGGAVVQCRSLLWAFVTSCIYSFVRLRYLEPPWQRLFLTCYSDVIRIHLMERSLMWWVMREGEGDFRMTSKAWLRCLMHSGREAWDMLTLRLWMWVDIISLCSPSIVYRVHHLMTALVILKSLSLFFHGINFYFVSVYGHQREVWAVVFYITHLYVSFN